MFSLPTSEGVKMSALALNTGLIATSPPALAIAVRLPRRTSCK
jgi:hypothetical protein